MYIIVEMELDGEYMPNSGMSKVYTSILNETYDEVWYKMNQFAQQRLNELFERYSDEAYGLNVEKMSNFEKFKEEHSSLINTHKNCQKYDCEECDQRCDRLQQIDQEAIVDLLNTIKNITTPQISNNRFDYDETHIVYNTSLDEIAVFISGIDNSNHWHEYRFKIFSF